MSDDVIVQVHDLHKTYKTKWLRREVQAVRGVSFEVKRGEIFGIVGPNGAGKTTTIKILTGLIRATRGSASLFGRPVDDVASRRRLGYLPEGPYFYEHLSVAELLRYYGSLHGMSRAEIAARAPALIERVGLAHAGKRQLGKFSKGMRQRAGLAQALINDPELVILDEPQSGLDPVGRKEVRDLIFELKREGKTVILSSHILPDVEAVCDRVAVVHRGEVKELGSLYELTSERVLHTEVLVRAQGVDADALRAELDGLELVERRAEVLVLRFGGEVALRATLEALFARDVEVLSVTPQRENLEDVFLRDTFKSSQERVQ